MRAFPYLCLISVFPAACAAQSKGTAPASAYYDAAGMEAPMEADMEASTAKRSEHFIPSMAQDVNKGRRTEVEFINGLVARKAAEIGLEAPANAGLTRAVREVERGERAPAPALLEGI